jgi:hypothetical protein
VGNKQWPVFFPIGLLRAWFCWVLVWFDCAESSPHNNRLGVPEDETPKNGPSVGLRGSDGGYTPASSPPGLVVVEPEQPVTEDLGRGEIRAVSPRQLMMMRAPSVPAPAPPVLATSEVVATHEPRPSGGKYSLAAADSFVPNGVPSEAPPSAMMDGPGPARRVGAGAGSYLDGSDHFAATRRADLMFANATQRLQQLKQQLHTRHSGSQSSAPSVPGSDASAAAAVAPPLAAVLAAPPPLASEERLPPPSAPPALSSALGSIPVINEQPVPSSPPSAKQHLMPNNTSHSPAASPGGVDIHRLSSSSSPRAVPQLVPIEDHRTHLAAPTAPHALDTTTPFAPTLSIPSPAPTTQPPTPARFWSPTATTATTATSATSATSAHSPHSTEHTKGARGFPRLAPLPGPGAAADAIRSGSGGHMIVVRALSARPAGVCAPCVWVCGTVLRRSFLLCVYVWV